MTETCSLALCDKASATYTNGRLTIGAKGTKPTPCHFVRIVKSPLAVEPPQFALSACIPEGKVCAQVMTPFEVVQQFDSGPHASVILIHAGGRMEIPVGKSDDKKALLCGEIPIPFEEKSFSGRQFKCTGCAEITLGISKAIDEAYDKAVSCVPRSHVMDAVTFIEIVKVSATYGGIAGFHQVTVEVLASVAP